MNSDVVHVLRPCTWVIIVKNKDKYNVYHVFCVPVQTITKEMDAVTNLMESRFHVFAPEVRSENTLNLVRYTSIFDTNLYETL